MPDRLLSLLPGLVALSLVFSFMPQALAQGSDPRAVLPPAQQVVDDMKGSSPRDSAARATAALQVMESLVTGLAGSRAASKQFTAAERQKLDEYSQAYQAIWGREYDRLPECEGEGCARYLYARCAQNYFFSAPFYRELIDRYLPPAWAATHVPRLPGQLWKTALALPPGTQAPKAMGTSLPCAGAASASQALVQAARQGSLLDGVYQSFLGPRATRDDPRFRAFLNQSLPVLAAGLGLLALWLLGYVWQLRKNVSLDPADPTRLRSPSSYELQTATGVAVGTSKGIQTITTTHTQDNRVTGQSSQTVVHDQFFIHSPDGSEKAVKLQGHDLAIRDGHILSMAWAEGKKDGYYLALRNHTLRKTVHFENGQRNLLGVRQRYTWLILLTLAALTGFLALAVDWWIRGEGATRIALTLGPLSVVVPLVMGIVLSVTARMRLRRLRRDIDERLVPEFDRRAAGL